MHRKPIRLAKVAAANDGYAARLLETVGTSPAAAISVAADDLKMVIRAMEHPDADVDEEAVAALIRIHLRIEAAGEELRGSRST